MLQILTSVQAEILIQIGPGCLLAFFFAQIHLFNFIILQKTNSHTKIQLSTK